jgi:hypothetical protein
VNEPLQTTLADAINFLRREGVPCALIGGMAVSFRGQPRVTADVDLVITADVERALRLTAALEGSRFKPLFADVADVVEKAFILPMRHRSTNVKVDLALGLSGFERQLVARAQPLDLGSTIAPVATAEDLLITKVLAGRPQDDQDARGLLMAQGAQLDWAYTLKTASDLGDALGQDLVGRITSLQQSISEHS